MKSKRAVYGRSNWRALDGLRVVEIASGVSGPYCGKLLADLGAEVIKVEPPRVGDAMRSIGPFMHDEPGVDRSLFFNFLNTNKVGITLDVCSTTGRRWLVALLADVDVLLIGGETHEIYRKQLGFDRFRSTLPGLTGVYVTPFGLTGPFAEYRGGELVAFQMSALGALTPGDNEDLTRPPLMPGGSHALMVAGVSAATATMHALFARDADGAGGRLVDVAENEGIASFQFMNMARWVYAADEGNRPRASPGQRIRCRDGQLSVMFGQDHQWKSWVEVMGNPEWATDPSLATRPARAERMAGVVIAVGSQEEWLRFRDSIGDPAWAHDARYEDQLARLRNRDELDERVAEWTLNRTADEVTACLQEVGVAAGPVHDAAGMYQDPQLNAREFFVEVEHPVVGRKPVMRLPWLIEDTDSQYWAAPTLGQDSEWVIREFLGLTAEEVEALSSDGVIC